MIRGNFVPHLDLHLVQSLEEELIKLKVLSNDASIQGVFLFFVLDGEKLNVLMTGMRDRLLVCLSGRN